MAVAIGGRWHPPQEWHNIDLKLPADPWLQAAADNDLGKSRRLGTIGLMLFSPRLVVFIIAPIVLMAARVVK